MSWTWLVLRPVLHPALERMRDNVEVFGPQPRCNKTPRGFHAGLIISDVLVWPSLPGDAVRTPGNEDEPAR